jgi:hypothetical protein
MRSSSQVVAQVVCSSLLPACSLVLVTCIDGVVRQAIMHSAVLFYVVSSPVMVLALDTCVLLAVVASTLAVPVGRLCESMRQPGHDHHQAVMIGKTKARQCPPEALEAAWNPRVLHKAGL